jgi:glutathione synthase/RimK-type ligase-like ATP-grasp enzyme
LLLRDLILEIVVIVLIGWEIVGGYEQMAVLRNLNTSAGETAKTLTALREQQELALKAQEATLHAITEMNAALHSDNPSMRHRQQ